jgi:threonine dehydrogenase-like Zn-dependent dehydrogenase
VRKGGRIGVRTYDPKVWHRSYDVLASRQFPLESFIAHRLPLKDATPGVELMKSK